MRVIASILLFAVSANAAKLQSNYLPPVSSQSAGGSSSFLSAPGQTFSGFSSSSESAFTQSGVATSYAAPPSGPVPSGLYGAPVRSYSTGTPVAILRFNNENSGDGSYRFEYQTENKISQQEEGRLQASGAEAATIVHGTYSYEAPDGQTITVSYVADENGFRAEGDHIPTPPPIPLAIQKSLEINAASSRTSGYPSSSSSFTRGVSSSSLIGTSQQQPQITRQYIAPTAQPSGGYRY